MKTSTYKNITMKVEAFEPGANASYQVGKEPEIRCTVAEVVKYHGKPNADVLAEIDDIENYGYACTGEFIEDDANYFVALNKCVQIMHTKRTADGKRIDKKVVFTEAEYRKYQTALYMNSGVSCYDKNGNFIENPFEEFPYSYVVDYSQDVYSILYDLSAHYYISFIGEKPDGNERIAKFVFKENPCSDGCFTHPGYFDQIEITAEEDEEEKPF